VQVRHEAHDGESNLRKQGRPFVIHRGGEKVGETTGIKDSSKRVILFRHDTDVREGDWVEDKESHARFFIADVDHVSDYMGQPVHVRVHYETRTHHERQESASQVIAMLDDIADAVWTLSDEKMPLEGKKRARALVRELQGIVRSLPSGAAGGLAGDIASRFLDGG
jgi:hypothetical protein